MVVLTVALSLFKLDTVMAQGQIECATVAGSSLTPEEKQYREIPPQLTPTIVRHVSIAVHVVRYSDGSGEISSGDITTAIQQLNTAFSQVTIIFEVTSTDYIDNSTYASIDSLPEVYDLWALGYSQSNVLNVYFVPNAYFIGIADFPGRKLIVTNGAAPNSSTLAHEVGHNFYLRHTHSDAVDPPNDCTPATTLELVNGSNCNTAGDYICDTPAEPFTNCGTGIKNYVNFGCAYTGTFRDANNQLYNPDTRNFMGYSLASCRNRFSAEQTIVMQNYVSEAFDLLTTSVAISNEVNGSPHSGSTLTIDYEQVTSPGNLPLLDGNTYPGKTNHERLSGNNKHKDWNTVASEYTLSQDFTVDQATESGRTRKARFIALNPATVTTSLFDAPSISGGTLQFNDPWYLNSDGAQGNNFGPQVNVPLNQNNGMSGAYNQTVGGVFLNQGNPPEWTPPYYSVGAPNPNTIGGFTSYFLNWDNSNPSQVEYQNVNAQQTGVVFKQAGAAAKAKYKAYLRSS